MFYGAGKVGKTTLSAYMPTASILSVLSSQGKLGERDRVYVVCTDGGFSHSRLNQIMNANKCEPDSLKKHLVVLEPTTWTSQVKYVTKDIPSLIETRGLKPLLIAVDPITSLYRAEYLRVPSKWRFQKLLELARGIAEQLHVLQKIAREHEAVITITSWLRSDISLTKLPETERDFIGGRALEYHPSCAVRLSKLKHRPCVIEAFVKYSRFRPEGIKCHFEIFNGGIRDFEGEISG